jgi:hypothetical protein
MVKRQMTPPWGVLNPPRLDTPERFCLSEWSLDASKWRMHLAEADIELMQAVKALRAGRVS